MLSQQDNEAKSTAHKNVFAYMVKRITRQINKINKTLKDEGLDSKELVTLIYQCYNLNPITQDVRKGHLSQLQQLLTNCLQKDFNQFAVSFLSNLASIHQLLLTKLEDPLSSSEQSICETSKQVTVKLQEDFFSYQNQEELLKQVKIQQIYETHTKRNTFQNKKIKIKNKIKDKNKNKNKKTKPLAKKKKHQKKHSQMKLRANSNRKRFSHKSKKH